jgi:hypothetical protein
MLQSFMTVLGIGVPEQSSLGKPGELSYFSCIE